MPGHLAQRLLQDTFCQRVRIESLIMEQARKALKGRFLLTLGARQLRLATSLGFKDRPNKSRDRFYLMTVRPGQSRVDIFREAGGRENLIPGRTNSLTSVNSIPSAFSNVSRHQV